MFPAFTTALSALTADTAAIDVTGNNLANLDTTGFKASQVNFSDMMAEALGGVSGGNTVGGGVLPISTFTNYIQGAVTSTGVPTDAAIEGNGFFVVENSGANQTMYTRDGSFQMNADGYLTDANGNYVQGWLATNGVVTPTGPTSNIQVPTNSTMAASATTTMSMNVNLDASATSTTTTYSAPIQVYDSLGNPITLTATFTETAPGNWGYSVTMPSTDFPSTGTGTTPTPATPVSIGAGTLTFGTNGVLTGVTQTTPTPPTTTGTAIGPITLSTTGAVSGVTGLADGAGELNLNWNLVSSAGVPQITQYAEASAVNSTTQNGYAAGSLTNMTVANGGTVSATYSNGQNVTVAQLALANIANPNTLTQVGNNDLELSSNTAAPVLGAAGTGSMGQIEGLSLESSTVDMATEFTNLLAYERSYQAASKVITTSDQLMQTTVNLIQG
jgi:flagellar hook protein FlgE